MSDSSTSSDSIFQRMQSSDSSASYKEEPAPKFCALLHIGVLFWRGNQAFRWSGGRAVRSHWLEMEFEYGPAYYGEIGEMRVHCMVSSVDVYNQLQSHDGLLGEPFPGIHADRRAVHAYCARLVASLEGLESR